MRPNYPGKPLYSAICLFLFFATLSLNACGHTEAAPPDVAMDKAMQAIRDYGRGHQPSPGTSASEKPDQTDEAYSAHIRNILVQEDFAQLEKIAEQNRIERGRLLGGVWKTLAFYNGTSWSTASKPQKDSDLEMNIATLKKWIAAYPSSTAARLSLAYFYVNYSWQARGPGFADSVSDAQWRLFHQRNAQAEAILLDLVSFQQKDPFWYQTMQLVAHDQGWDQAQARELFDLAASFEPSDYHYYAEYTRYLLPQWYGNPGDIKDFAEETAARVPEPQGSMLYFWIFSSRTCYCRDALKDLPQANYEKLKQGYANITRLYGVSNLNANRFAYMSSTFHDQPAAREAFAEVTKMDENIWTYQQVFDQARDWANQP